MHITLRRQRTIAEKGSRTYHTLRWMSFLFVVFITTLTGIAGWFIYTQIYAVIGNSETILLLRNNPHFEPIQFNLYDKTTASWTAKHADKDLDISYDPFYDVDLTVVSTSTIETSTTSEQLPDQIIPTR